MGETAAKGMVQPPFPAIRPRRDPRVILCPPEQAAGPYGLRCPHRLRPLGAGPCLCDRCLCSGSLFPPLAAVASAAVLVPDGAPGTAFPKAGHKKKALLSSKAFLWCAISGRHLPPFLLIRHHRDPRSKNGPPDRFCPPEQTAGPSCSRPRWRTGYCFPDGST